MPKGSTPTFTRAPEEVRRSSYALVHADCRDVLSSIDDGIVALTHTSPPYNIKLSTGNGLKNGSGGKWPNAELLEGYDVHDDAMPHEEYVEWQRDCLRAMMRVLKPTGAIFYNHK